MLEKAVIESVQVEFVVEIALVGRLSLAECFQIVTRH